MQRDASLNSESPKHAGEQRGDQCRGSRDDARGGAISWFYIHWEYCNLRNVTSFSVSAFQGNKSFNGIICILA